jgi:hypothetical protein
VSFEDITKLVSIVATAGTLIVSLVTLNLSLRKWQNTLEQQTMAFKEQARRARLESARIAWELANSLHESPAASNALELLDGEAARVETPQHGAHDVSEDDVRSALTSGLDQPAPNEKVAAIRFAFDSMFYALDRLRSATKAGLISQDDLSSATIYYCQKLTTTHQFALEYGRMAYPSTVDFVKELGGRPSVTPKL